MMTLEQSVILPCSVDVVVYYKALTDLQSWRCFQIRRYDNINIGCKEGKQIEKFCVRAGPSGRAVWG